MKIFDCFTFFNELEILDLRLMTLSPVVDYFVLVEANKSFTGKKKDFLFEKNHDKYKDYLEKIIYVKVTDASTKPDDVWAIENFQRNAISRGLNDAKPEDRIILSDVDEIPNPKILAQVKDSESPITFNQYLFYYYVNCFGNRTWNGSIMIPFSQMVVPDKLRTMGRKGTNRIKGSGWHYSYMGGLEKIKSKLNNLSDAYTRIDMVGSDEDILRKMKTQKNLWDEKLEYKLIDIKENGYAPESIESFIKKYPSFYFKDKNSATF